jgi:RNA polymerase sigma-70 factor (ECF subfamily)
MRPDPSPSYLDRLRARDADAWADLVRVWQPSVYSWCRRRGLQPTDAEEISQRVFVSLFRRGIDRFRGDGAGSFRAWLWVVARNRVTEHFREQARQPRLEGPDSGLAEPPSVDPESLRELFDLRGPLGRAADLIRARVAPRTWRAFWRVVVDDQSVERVAEELGMSVASVYTARSRVLRELRELLGKESGERR